MVPITVKYTTQYVSPEEKRLLDLIHRSTTEQNRLKKTLVKFDLLEETRLNPSFNFNIICKPQEDGAGDFSLINKIGKELIENGIPSSKLTFVISTTNLYLFLQEFTNYTLKNNCELNKIIFSQLDLHKKINNIPTGLQLIGLEIGNFNSGPNLNTKNKILTKEISSIGEVNKDIFNKNINYRLMNDIILKLKENKTNFKRNLEEIKSDVYGGKLGTLIPFIYSRIINESAFAGSKIVFLDWSSGERTDVNTIYQHFLDNCRLDGQDEQTINIQLLGTFTKYNNIDILSRCNRNRVFYLNEGGVNNPPNTHCMGIGNGSIGIFKAPVVTKTKVQVIEMLSTKLSVNDETINKYHIAYVGQMLNYEINKDRIDISTEDSDNVFGIFNIQRVFLFLKLLKKKYENARNETIYVFALNVFQKILDIYDQRINESGVFPEYNSIEKTFQINNTSKIKIKFFERIEPDLFYAFVKHSEPILFTTGDQSYQEALSFGKLVFHDYFDHRIRMVNVLLDCYNNFCNTTNNNYKNFLNRYLLNISGDAIYEYNFQTHIVDFFGNQPMIIALGETLRDYFNSDNPNNTKFYEFYNKFYDFKKEFKKIIFLMQNNHLTQALTGTFMTEQVESQLINVNNASYMEKYLKYKNKYLKLKEKIGGTIIWNEQNMIGDNIRYNQGLGEERSKHSPNFTDKQIEITLTFLTYLNSKIKFKLIKNGEIIYGNSIIQNYDSGKIIGRGANGIAVCYDDNIVIKISKNSLTRRNIVDDEVINMIELYNGSDGYKFRDDNLVKLLGVVYVNDLNNIIKKFDESRTHIISNFEPGVDNITEQDRIGFVIMEKYEGTLSNIDVTRLDLNTKLDIIYQMINQLLYFFNKGYYHTDLHEENWFYKMVNQRHVMRISDYGSEIKSQDEKIGVFRLSDDSSIQDKEKARSLSSLALGLTQKNLITQESYFSLLGIEDYSALKRKLGEIIYNKYRSEASRNQVDVTLLRNIGILLL
jgi:hypothetical protein